MTQQEFINTIEDRALYWYDKVKLLPSLTIGVACKESGYGGATKKSKLVSEYNNLYGIKYYSSNPLSKKYVELGTYEWNKELKQYEPALAKWCVFDNWNESVDSFAELMQRDLYKEAILNSKCYQEATYWLINKGYATSPVYVQSLRALIKQWKLYNLDYKKEYESDLTNNFKWYEAFSSLRLNNFTYTRAIEPEEKYWDNIVRVALQVQKIRNKLGKPLPVNSWWRTKEYNDTLKGASKTSYHLRGLAIDLPTPAGMTPTTFRDFIKNQCNTEFTNFIVYSWGVHCDMR